MIKFLLVSQKILEDDVTSPFIIYIKTKSKYQFTKKL